MKIRLPQTPLSAISAALILSAVCIATPRAEASAIVFDEQFNYANTTALQAAWTKVDASVQSMSLGTDSAIDPTQPYAVLPNSLSSRAIGTTLTGDWTVSYNVLQTNVQRGSWLGLLDASGQHGYGVLWDSGNAGVTGTGTVSIRKFDLSTAISSWSQNGTQIGSSTSSGHQITATPMALFTLNYVAATGTLTLFVDNVQKLSVTDTSFSSFSTVYLKGNSSQYYDNILIAVPEPETAPLLVGAGLGAWFLVRRRRRA